VTTVVLGMGVTTDGAVVIGTSGAVRTAEISRHEEGKITVFQCMSLIPFILG
jgi:hypothetical protein